MKNKNLLLSAFFLYLSSILFSCSEKELVKSLKLKSDLNIISNVCFSSQLEENEIEKIFENNINNSWIAFDKNSESEVINLEFLNQKFISKINIYSGENENFGKVEKVRIYIDENYFEIFGIENNEIILNKKIKKLTVQVYESSDYNCFTAYIDSTEHKFTNENLSKTAKIDSIVFFKDSSNFYKIIAERKYLNLKEIQKLEKTFFAENINKHFIDNSEIINSFIINSNGKIFADVLNENKIILLNGFFTLKSSNQNNIILEFTGKMSETEDSITNISEIKTEISISENKIHIDSILDMFYKVPDDAFVRVIELDTSIILDMRYATTNNFTQTQLYECEDCLLRYKVAKELVEANKHLLTLGYKIKLFDCYRPHSVQYKMWEVMPNINFVAPPEKGSIHNRGGAIDITFCDLNNNELDMGTEYDFFGREAFHAYELLNDTILQNRLFLKNTLQNFNFKAIKTEWWHYSHSSCLQYEISDFQLPCGKN